MATIPTEPEATRVPAAFEALGLAAVSEGEVLEPVEPVVPVALCIC